MIFFSILEMIGISFILIGVFIYLRVFLSRNKNQYRFETNLKKNPTFAILIPARDESSVIEGLLKSIEKQTRTQLMKDVYVIVETPEDPTVQICQEHGASIIIRKHLEKQSKGYALEEAIEQLCQNEIYYDAYFIFDADNILDQNYLYEMEKDYQKGFAISTGYRNYKNGDSSLVAAAAGLIYFLINEVRNKRGMKHKKNVILSGTGFYINGNYIKEWGTYPFHSLTEDIELSYYACLHEMSTTYNEKAIFYDEQPLTYKESVKQRKRWIKGFLSNWTHSITKFKKQLKKHPINRFSVISNMYGITPLLFLVFGLIFFLLSKAIPFIIYFNRPVAFFRDLILSFYAVLILVYFALVLLTYYILKKGKEKINLSPKTQKIVLWFHPIFLASYIPVFIMTLFQKKIGWDQMKREENLDKTRNDDYTHK